jgi:predicted RNase H-like HicB family nuclease
VIFSLVKALKHLFTQIQLNKFSYSGLLQSPDHCRLLIKILSAFLLEKVVTESSYRIYLDLDSIKLNAYEFGRITMLIQNIQAALEKAKYEIIEDEEPYYGEVPELKGVWATGKTLEECRRNLEEVIDEWIVFRLRKGLSIPES